MPDPSRHFLIENSIFEPVKLKRQQAGRADASNGPDLPAGRRMVLYAGTFEVYQGLDTLLAAFAQAHPACPEALLVLVGGTAGQVERIAAQAAELGIGEHVLVLGRMPKAGATRYLEAASVLVSPRSHGTNTPLKVYEQLASGVPLVATRILSHTQVLDEKVAFLVDPAPEPMAAGLIRALTDHAACEAVVANAKALYERAYARPVYVAKMRALLDRVGASEPVHEHRVATHGKS